jgi:dolichol-phosphate mannosyltransferase
MSIPLKAIMRGFIWMVIPISWQNRKHGVAKLKIKETGSRDFFIFIYACIWLHDKIEAVPLSELAQGERKLFG